MKILHSGIPAQYVQQPNSATYLLILRDQKRSIYLMRPNLQLFSLLRSHDFQGCHYQPAAFVVLNVCANLSCHSRVTVTVQVIIL